MAGSLIAEMSVRVSVDNHVVRVAIGRPGLPDTSGLTVDKPLTTFQADELAALVGRYHAEESGKG
jgi:hypothetical protein